VGNACYHSVQNLLSSHLLSKILKMKENTCCFVWSKIWSLTLREEHKLKVFENRVMRRVFGPKKNSGEDFIMRSFVTCMHHQIE
jgi:hypothetical protein